MSGTINKDGIIVRQGDSFNIKLSFKEKSGAINLSGAQIKMAVTDSEGRKLLQKVGVISDAVRGLAAIPLTPCDTNIPVGEYFTDIEVKFPDGQVHTIYPQNVNTVAYFRVTAQVTE